MDIHSLNPSDLPPEVKKIIDDVLGVVDEERAIEFLQEAIERMAHISFSNFLIAADPKPSFEHGSKLLREAYEVYPKFLSEGFRKIKGEKADSVTVARIITLLSLCSLWKIASYGHNPVELEKIDDASQVIMDQACAILSRPEGDEAEETSE